MQTTLSKTSAATFFACVLIAVTAFSQSVPPLPGFARIPAGTFEMGDHHSFVDPQHESDEVPIHRVRLDAFYIGINDVTTREYCEFLNSALARREIEVRDGGVYLTGGRDLLFETRAMSPYSRIGWDGKAFAVLDGKGDHPVVCIGWEGAAAYCNWASARKHLPLCYDTRTWACDFNKRGFRLPTEAEWEYAARGGRQNPYRNFPWGDDADSAKANWPESHNPFRAGSQPWTTPVGFFDGRLKRKSDFNWSGPQETFQTGNGANGYGLFDMAGNVWQFVNDWYERDYYRYSPAENPPGPEHGSPMPDGRPYRGMRGGNWFNGENGHSRVSNRDPSYYRGPQDPQHPYYHVGFRVALPIAAETRPPIKPTPVPLTASQGREPGPARGGIRLFPRNVEEELNLSGDQRQQIAALEQEVNARLAQILTPEQKRLVEESRPRGGRGGEPGPPNPGAQGAGSARPAGAFVLRSPEVGDGGELPKEFTGDGISATLPLEWSGVPIGTAGYALIMHHIDPQGVVKRYWTLYNIPADVHSLPKSVRGIGTLGNNSINGRTEYAPPHSQGPGAKTYIFTVYALSSALRISVPPAGVSREVLLSAMEGKILASAEMRVVYTREGLDGGQPPRDDRPGGRRQGGRRQGGGGGRDRPGGGRGPAHEDNKLPRSKTPGQTIGLFLNTPRAFNGYTLMAPKHNNVTYLIDNQGRIVNQWKSSYEPGQSAYLLPDGHLLRAGMMKVQGGTGGGEGGRIEEYDWNGKLIWEFELATRDRQLHHDIKPLPNGHVLALMVERKSRDEAVAAGFDPDALRDDTLEADAVVEIEPTLPKGGRIVWEWHVWDHLTHGVDRAAHPELVDPRGSGRAIPAFWNHMNSLDYNAALDQILLSVRGNNEIWIIDHSTTSAQAAGHSGGRSGKGGDLIYRWGNPAAYRRGTQSGQQLIQQHDAEWIPAGLPGAGHITIFNNGYDRGWSSIEEIVPPIDSAGRYTLTPGQPYGPDKPVWHYEAANRADFFSSEISGALRLPNGNTLICAGVIGNLFEVTPGGETVWQYVNPVVRGGILAQGETPGKDVRGHLFNAVFKVERYAPDYPGLRGCDLTPKGIIERPASDKGKTGLDKANAPPEEGRGGRRGGR